MSSDENKDRPSNRLPMPPYRQRGRHAASLPVDLAEPPIAPREVAPRFDVGDCVRISLPSETLTVASYSRLAVELVYQDTAGKLQSLFLPANLLACVKPRGRRPIEGDKVRLPSGGPVMTVARLAKPHGHHGKCFCLWEEDGKEMNLWCDADLLEVIDA